VQFAQETNAWPAAVIAPSVGANPTVSQIVGTISGRYSSLLNAAANPFGAAYPTGTMTWTMSGGNANNTTIAFVTADGGSNWTCNTGSMLSRYRPQSCR
jgi:hypothetical protein